LIHAAILGDAVQRPRLQPIQIPSRLGDPNDRDLQVMPFHQCLQRWKNLLVGKISGRAKEYQRI
jgi:hypothetical protein